MTCKHCGAALDDGAAFCGNCGAKCEHPSFCTRCGSPMAEGAAFCGRCGAQKAAPPPPTVPAEPVIIPEPGPIVAPEPETIQEPAPEPIQVTPPLSAFCAQCGAPVPQGQPLCAACMIQNAQAKPIVLEPLPPKKEKKPRKHRSVPSASMRIVLRICSSLLSLLLFFSILATAVVADMRQLMDVENLEEVVSEALDGSITTGPVLAIGVRGSRDGADEQDEETTSEIELTDLIYDILGDAFGNELDMSQEEMETFIQRSTANELLAEKTASFLSDFINGTESTQITADEVIDLIEDNKELLEEICGVDLDRRKLKEVKSNVRDYFENNDISQMIQQDIIVRARGITLGSGYTVGDAMDGLKAVTSLQTMLILIGIDLFLMLALFFTNWMRLHAALNWIGSTLMSAGGLLSLPVLVLQFVPKLLTDALGTEVGGMIASLVGLIGPVHYIIFLLGLAFLIGGIVTKIISKASAR